MQKFGRVILRSLGIGGIIVLIALDSYVDDLPLKDPEKLAALERDHAWMFSYNLLIMVIGIMLFVLVTLSPDLLRMWRRRKARRSMNRERF